MASKKKTTRQHKAPAPAPFHERFEISFDMNGVRQKFMNRVRNYIFQNMFGNYDEDHRNARWRAANALGEVYRDFNDLDHYVQGDFYRCLQVLEACYQGLQDEKRYRFNALVSIALSESEADIGIGWEPPIFVRTGATLLDLHLVNEPLRWLSDPKYAAVYTPFEKGLGHFLESAKKPQLLQDVITDMYESVEALSKITTGRSNRDLSANAELFLNAVKASPEYKGILKAYISYANKFRHAADDLAARSALTSREVESFIYLTGLFIRLAMSTTGKTD